MSQDPFPLMPPRSTELRLLHFDENVYIADNSTILYKLVDALCGTTGAGALINEIFLARLSGALETIYFNDLDYIFGKVNFLSRSPAESYTYNPQIDLLTSTQWDEVKIKDAWYRARIKDFFVAVGLGGTKDGIRMCVNAAVGVDADLYEVWRYKDNFGITTNLGRSPISARNEVAVRPHKESLKPEELRLLRDMLAKITPLDVVVTVNVQGLATTSPVPVSAAASDSTYYEIQRMVTATPALALMPPPELLPIDLLPSEQWLFDAQTDPQLAPTAAFNITAESSYYYVVGGGKQSPIDSVTYGVLQSDGSVKIEPDFQVFDTTGQYGLKQPYEKVDSPDNYPGGKFGIHPRRAPAENPDHTAYRFLWESQADYVAHKAIEVLGLGGIADSDGFCLPIRQASSVARTFTPDQAIAFFPPSRDSTVSSSLTRRRITQPLYEIRDPANFVRS